MMDEDKTVFCTKVNQHLYIRPSGKVSLCCLIDHIVVGDLKKNSLSEIVTSPNYQEALRTSPNSCKTVSAILGCRTSGPLLKKITEIELALFGTCNLQCPMCHTWKIKEKTSLASIWDDLEKNFLHDLELLTIHGGEPLLHQDLSTLISLLEKNKKKRLLKIITNGHYSINPKIANIFRSETIKKISLSIDTIDPLTYEKLRYPGKLDLPLKTIDYLLNEHKNEIDLDLNVTVQQENHHQLADLVDFAELKKIPLHFFHLHSPNDLSTTTMPEEPKRKYFGQLLFLFQKTKNKQFLNLAQPHFLQTSFPDSNLEMLKKIATFYQMDIAKERHE